jgi:hypothetical protein
LKTRFTQTIQKSEVLPWKLPWAIPLFPRGVSTKGWRGVYTPILKTFSSPICLKSSVRMERFRCFRRGF